MIENWYALYTKPRWERKVATQLQELGIECYCPVFTEVRQWSDRKKKVTSPLFKSYVFVRLSDKERSRVFVVPGVVQYVFWLGKPAIVWDREIEVIKQWLDGGHVNEIEIGNFSPGDRVQIATGSFKGKEAVVQKVGKNRMKLILKNLGLVVNVRTCDVIE